MNNRFNNKNEKRISFILITKNREAQLRETLPTFRNLIKPSDELIIIDGASEDNTRDVVAENKDMVTVFISEPDVNSAHALNKGVLKARGKYIVLLFDEDHMHTKALEQAISVLEKHSEIDVLVCGGTKHFIDRNFSRPFYHPPDTNYGKSPEDAFIYGTCANGFVIRRSVFAKSGLFQIDSIANDLIFIAQCIYHGGIVRFCRIKLFDHYISNQSVSSKKRKEIKAERNRFIKQYCSPEFAKRRRMRHLGKERFLNALWYKSMTDYWSKVLFKEGLGGLWRKGVQKKHRRQKPLPSEYLWDGGFS